MGQSIKEIMPVKTSQRDGASTAEFDQAVDVRKFCGRLLMFFPILMVFFIFPTVILWKAGELERIDRVVEQQAEFKNVILFEKAYNGKMGYYAISAVEKRKPQVIALGTSRVMSFRSKFFKPEVTFYNAGGGAMEIGHFREFLNRLPDSAVPKVMIVGMDQVYFNASRLFDPDLHDVQKFYSEASPLGIWQNAVQKIIVDYAAGKFRLTDVFSLRPSKIRKIGLGAVATDSGTLNDGSHYYGGFIRNPQADPDWEFRTALKEIVTGDGFFRHGRESSRQAFQELDAFLKECHRRNIHVIGFMTPYPHKVYQAMMDAGSDYGYLIHLRRDMEPLFKKFGFSFFDFSDLAWIGASDQETFDGHHGSEKAYLRLFLQMAKTDPVLASMTDIAELQKRLDQSVSPYIVFGVDEF